MTQHVPGGEEREKERMGPVRWATSALKETCGSGRSATYVQSTSHEAIVG